MLSLWFLFHFPFNIGVNRKRTTRLFNLYKQSLSVGLWALVQIFNGTFFKFFSMSRLLILKVIEKTYYVLSTNNIPKFIQDPMTITIVSTIRPGSGTSGLDSRARFIEDLLLLVSRLHFTQNWSVQSIERIKLKKMKKEFDTIHIYISRVSRLGAGPNLTYSNRPKMSKLLSLRLKTRSTSRYELKIWNEFSFEKMPSFLQISRLR